MLRQAIDNDIKANLSLLLPIIMHYFNILQTIVELTMSTELFACTVLRKRVMCDVNVDSYNHKAERIVTRMKAEILIKMIKSYYFPKYINICTFVYQFI